jgi:uncharacterized Zn-finger protein
MLKPQNTEKPMEEITVDPFASEKIHLKVEESVQEQEPESPDFHEDSNDGNQMSSDDEYQPEQDELESMEYVDNDFEIDLKPATLPEIPDNSNLPPPPQFNCQLCSKTFKKKSLLQNHLNYHANRRDYTCPRCSKNFVEGKGLLRHCRNVHDFPESELNEMKEKLKAQQLEKQKRLKSENKKEKASPKQKFQCDVCLKKYLSIKYLQEHKILQHLGSAPFTCPICNRGFLNLTLLATHKLYHTNQRNFVCSFCSKTFVERKSFNNHLRKTHQLSEKEVQEQRTEQNESGKDYLCEICSKSFQSLQLLGNHMKYHQGVKSQKCPLCPSSFIESRGLNNHLRRTHNLTEEEIYKVEEH